MSNIKQKLTEMSNKPELQVDDSVIKNPSEAKRLSQNYTLKYVDKKHPSNSSYNSPDSSSSYTSSSTMVSEDDAVIEPQDKETIKYLSNIKDPISNRVSQPFVIGAKKYQMVRGITPKKEKISAVYCHDDLDSLGKNLIVSIEEFEKKVALPAKQLAEKQLEEEEKLKVAELNNQAKEKEQQANQQKKEEAKYAGSKHFLVNRNTGDVRNFKSVKDLLSQEKLDEEDYMGVQEFKQHINKKLFGGREKSGVLNELEPATPPTEMEQKEVTTLMDLIKKKIPPYNFTTIKTPVAKREAIESFAEMIGVPPNQLNNIISGLRDMASDSTQQQQISYQQRSSIQEHKVITKNDLIDSLRINKIIKVKDIR